MLTLKSHLKEMNIFNQRIFVRADLNVPLDRDGTILDDYRLQKMLPTLDYILSQGGKIILATHLGRPKKQEPHLSTRHLIPWFKSRNYEIIFEPDLQQAALKSHVVPQGHILLLENLRFFKGEKESNDTFAKQLHACADSYVQDAFGVVHRTDTSVTLLAKLFDKHHRTIGFLIEHELQELNKLLMCPPQPFMLILGGGKISDKIPLIERMIDKIKILALCPAIVFSFLKVQGKNIGKSLVDEEHLNACRKIIIEAQKRNVDILIPQDYQIALDNFNGPLSYARADNFPVNGVGISIGEKTIAYFKPYIQHAQSIFYNGTMGTLERPETLDGMKKLLACIAESDAYSVLGGGDSAAVAQKYKLINAFDHVSTGGGATLAYLSGKRLPGLDACIYEH